MTTRAFPLAAKGIGHPSEHEFGARDIDSDKHFDADVRSP